MCGKADLQSAIRNLQFGNMPVAGVKKILLPEMAKLRAQLTRQSEVIVDDQADLRTARDRQNRFRQAAHFVERGLLGAELDQIRAAFAELLCEDFRSAAMQVGRVHESVKFAIGEGFHAGFLNLNLLLDLNLRRRAIGCGSRLRKRLRLRREKAFALLVFRTTSF
jgi:hypothetical protein